MSSAADLARLRRRLRERAGEAAAYESTVGSTPAGSAQQLVGRGRIVGVERRSARLPVVDAPRVASGLVGPVDRRVQVPRDSRAAFPKQPATAHQPTAALSTRYELPGDRVVRPEPDDADEAR